MTAIIRTYWAWRIVDSSDKSYMFVPFGLWSEAELSAGVIVGCLPVMPKFFQHAGLKVHTVFSSQFKSGGRSVKSKIGGLTKIKGFLIKHSTELSTYKSDGHQGPQLHGEYLTPDQSTASQPRTQTAYATIQAPRVWTATRRDDLECGHQSS